MEMASASLWTILRGERERPATPAIDPTAAHPAFELKRPMLKRTSSLVTGNRRSYGAR